MKKSSYSRIIVSVIIITFILFNFVFEGFSQEGYNSLVNDQDISADDATSAANQDENITDSSEIPNDEDVPALQNSNPDESTPSHENSEYDEDEQVSVTTVTVVSLTTLTFASFWMIWWRGEGFDSEFTVHEWSWFEDTAEDGGSDKLGHMWGTYVGTRIGNQLFRWLGYSRNMSAILSFACVTAIINIAEFADGWTHHTFDPVDALFNLFGASLSLVGIYFPRFDDFFAFRLGYYPSEEVKEYFKGENEAYPYVDYNGMTYLFDFKTFGIKSLENTWAFPFRYLFIGFNFTVDWYQPDETPDKKARYIGFHLGINIGDALTQYCSDIKLLSSLLATILKYYSIPFTNICFQWDLNSSDFRVNFGIRDRW